jgi:glutathione S-transferase
MSQPHLVLCDLGPSSEAGLESYSPFCLKVHRALVLAGLAYTTRRGRAPSDFADLDPARQVPVLLVDDTPVADSTAILARIASLAPGTLEPADARARAEAWLWEDWADRALSGYLVAARWADAKNWPTVRDAYFGEAPWFVRAFVAPAIRRRVVASLVARDVLRGGETALWADFRRILDFLEVRAPSESFWVSDEPSVADIALFAQLRQLRSVLLCRAQSREIALRPRLDDWMDRVDAATRAPLSARLAAAA